MGEFYIKCPVLINRSNYYSYSVFQRLYLWCRPGCRAQWTSFTDQNSLFGTLSDNITTVSDCQNICVNERDCVAIDFDFQDDSCWLHYCAKDLLDSNTFLQINTTQYRLSRTCESATTASTGLLSTEHKTAPFATCRWWWWNCLFLPCAEKLELVLSTAPKTWDNTDKDSKNRKRSH